MQDICQSLQKKRDLRQVYCQRADDLITDVAIINKTTRLYEEQLEEM